jgi:hypothetical protein
MLLLIYVIFLNKNAFIFFLGGWGLGVGGCLQPALLYVVPGVIGLVVIRWLWNGEVKQVS